MFSEKLIKDNLQLLTTDGVAHFYNEYRSEDCYGLHKVNVVFQQYFSLEQNIKKRVAIVNLIFNHIYNKEWNSPFLYDLYSRGEKVQIFIETNYDDLPTFYLHNCYVTNISYSNLSKCGEYVDTDVHLSVEYVEKDIENDRQNSTQG